LKEIYYWSQERRHRQRRADACQPTAVQAFRAAISDDALLPQGGKVKTTLRSDATATGTAWGIVEVTRIAWSQSK
jgi:hypothetical protein